MVSWLPLCLIFGSTFAEPPAFRSEVTATAGVHARYVDWLAPMGCVTNLQSSSDHATWVDFTPPAYGLGQEFTTLLHYYGTPAAGGNPPTPPLLLPCLQYSIQWQSDSSALVSWTKQNTGGSLIRASALSSLDFSTFPFQMHFFTTTHRIELTAMPQPLRKDGTNALPTSLPALENEDISTFAMFPSVYAAAVAHLAAPPSVSGTSTSTSTVTTTSGDRKFYRTRQVAVDLDGDGILDPWEFSNGMNGFDPQDAARDSDGDGLSNLLENSLGLDPNGPDADGDGVRDGLEIQLGRSPSSVPTGSGPAGPAALSIHFPTAQK